MPRSSLVCLGASLALLAAACSGDDGAAEAGATTSTAPTTTVAPAPSVPGGCPPSGPPAAPEGPAATLEVLSEDEPRVSAAVYPRPDYEGDPWSQWGQGIALPDGRFLSAIGDHLGRDGNSYLYVFDPSTGALTQFADVHEVVGHQAGDWGYGKIHAPMVAGPCGEVFVTTYWGDSDDIEFGGTYAGDVLLRIDPSTLAVESLGAPVPEHGIPSLAGAAEGVLYGEAVDPTAGEDYTGTFFVYDTAAREVVFSTEEEDHAVFRTVLVTPDGRGWFSAGVGQSYVYDPEADTVELVDTPGGKLRASTAPAPDGTVYAATHEPDVLFAVEPSGSIREIGPLREYTASMALDPSGEHLYYVPEAHGTSWVEGTPLIRVDTATGEEEVVVELNDLAEEQLDLTLGGTYDVVMDPSGERLYLGMNAGPTGVEDAAFGEVVLVVVDLA
jgi:hypothetical protein